MRNRIKSLREMKDVPNGMGPLSPGNGGDAPRKIGELAIDIVMSSISREEKLRLIGSLIDMIAKLSPREKSGATVIKEHLQGFVSELSSRARTPGSPRELREGKSRRSAVPATPEELRQRYR